MAATPSKRRLKTTTEYIYETLFKDGKDSDVVVKALGRSWNLHKVTYSIMLILSKYSRKRIL